MTSPYLPGGSQLVPATRFVLLADTTNRVQLIDESVKTKDGATFIGIWESPPQLEAPQTQGRLRTLEMITLRYSSEAATTIRIEGSADGGETWTVSKDISIEATGNRLASKNVQLRVTGDDVRFRLLFDTDILVKVMGYIPRILVRGGLEYYIP